MKSFKQILHEAINVSDNPNFWKWFGDSVVVDSNGNPAVMYHGTSGKGMAGIQRKGFLPWSHFTKASDTANKFSKISIQGTNLIVYLSIQNPVRTRDLAEWDVKDVARELWDLDIFNESEYESMLYSDHCDLSGLIQSKGYDGIVYDNEGEGGGDAFIIFKPTQIKSAIGNNGDFDPNNPDITK